MEINPDIDGRAGRKKGVVRHNAKPCLVDGCNNRSKARGLCTGHWRQWSKGRDFTPLRAHHRIADGMKFCPDCEQTKQISEFHTRNTSKYLVHGQCKPCTNIRLRMRTYGIDRDTVVSMMERGCDVCGSRPDDVKQIHIDHCHDSGVVRGALCTGCNTALGLAKNNPETLRRLAEYVERAGQ